MNFATLYPRAPVAPICSPMTLIQTGVTSLKGGWIVRPTKETKQAIKDSVAQASVNSWAGNLNKAANNTSLLPEDMQAHLLTRLPIHLNSMRDGSAKNTDWFEVMGMVRAMIAIEHKSWFTVQRAPIIRAWDALLQLQQRHYMEKAGTWSMPLAATPEEMDALDEAYAAHGVQLSLLTRGDFLAHIRLSMAWHSTHLQAIVEGWRADLEVAA